MISSREGGPSGPPFPHPWANLGTVYLTNPDPRTGEWVGSVEVDGRLYELILALEPITEVCDYVSSRLRVVCRLPDGHDTAHFPISEELVCVFPDIYIKRLTLVPEDDENAHQRP